MLPPAHRSFRTARSCRLQPGSPDGGGRPVPGARCTVDCCAPQSLEILLESHQALGAYEVLARLGAEGFGSQPPVCLPGTGF